MNLREPVQFKLLVTLSFVPWLVYHFLLGSFVGAIFDALTIASNGVTLWAMLKEKKNSKA